MSIAQHHLTTVKEMVRDKSRHLLANSRETGEDRPVITFVQKKRRWWGRPYHEVVTENLLTWKFDEGFRLTVDGGVAGYLQAHVLNGEVLTDKHGKPIGGWMRLNDLSQLSTLDLHRIQTCLKNL